MCNKRSDAVSHGTVATMRRGSSTCACANSRPVRRALRSMQDADQVDHGVLAADQVAQRRSSMHVAFDDIDRRQHDQVPRPRAPPGRHRNPQAARGQPRDDVAPDETGAADDEDVVNVACRDSMRARALRDWQVRARRSVPAAFGAIVPRRAFKRWRRLVVEQRGVVDAVRHHLLDVVARLVERDRLGKHGAFDRLRQRARQRAGGPARRCRPRWRASASRRDRRAPFSDSRCPAAG